MQLRPRHYVLLAVILGLFVFNMIRHRRDDRNAISNTPAPVLINKPRIDTPPGPPSTTPPPFATMLPPSYTPAYQDLQKLLPLDPNQQDGHLADIHGCMIWLEFYRQGMAQTHPDPQMKARALHHLDNCVKYHQDTGA